MQAMTQMIRPLRPLPWLPFGSRWLQVPLYLGLSAPHKQESP
jgi:hypothetical protein